MKHLTRKQAIKKYYRRNFGGLANTEFLRGLVSFLDHRPETLNEQKSIDKLMADFIWDLEKE